MTGYNGTYPGPTFMIPRGREVVVRTLNQGSTVAAMHLHGSYTHSPWDGWAGDEMQVGQYKVSGMANASLELLRGNHSMKRRLPVTY